MFITLFGPWEQHNGFSYQQFMAVDYRYNRWMVLQTGYNCIGKPSIVIEYCYNPNAEQAIEVYASVYRANYGGLEAYLEDCSLKEEDLIDGIPNPSWALYCQLV